METFNWDVAPNMSVKANPRVKTIKFGDGYEQRIKDGINNDLRTYNVTLNAHLGQQMLNIQQYQLQQHSRRLSHDTKENAA